MDINEDYNIDCYGKLQGYNGNQKNIVIPKGVREIDFAALSNRNLESVIIPDSVREIGDCALIDNNLKEIELSKNLKYIGSNAFENNNIEKIIINSNYLEINYNAFLFNPLKKIKITGEIISREGWQFVSVKVLEIAMYFVNRAFCSLCPNIEELYIDNNISISDKVRVKDFLSKCKLNEKKHLKNIYIKKEISFMEKATLKRMYPNITFLYGEQNFLPEKKDNTKQENMVKTELQEKIDKIYQLASLLNEEERILIENKVSLLIDKYKDDLKKCQPNFAITDKSPINLQPKDIKTLKINFQKDLDTIINNLAVAKSITKLIEDIKNYKNLFDIELANIPKEATTTEEQINFIIYTYQKTLDISIKNQLMDILNHFQEEASQEIILAFNNTNKLSLKLDITTDFQMQVTKLYDKIKNFQIKKATYQELLDSLELKNNSELAIDIRTIKEIIKIFYLSDKNKYNEELDKIIRKYKNYINKIIKDENIENIKKPSEIELEIRKELQPFLEEIQRLTPEAISNHKLQDELINTLKYVKKEEVESFNGAIIDRVKEIEFYLENEYINADINAKIYSLITSCLIKWLEELNTNGYRILENIPKNTGTDKLSNNFQFELLILKELLNIKDSIENYINESIEYNKTINEVLSLDDSTSLNKNS